MPKVTWKTTEPELWEERVRYVGCSWLPSLRPYEKKIYEFTSLGKKLVFLKADINRMETVQRS